MQVKTKDPDRTPLLNPHILGSLENATNDTHNNLIISMEGGWGQVSVKNTT